jgi:hypothetical protein|tara:strand:- start:2703 stop:3200 length:498 start_codon:yes stop_codon:yes gene_type:complete
MLKRFSKRFFIILFTSLSVIGCSTENQHLSVDKFTLRSIKIEDSDAAMVRGDQQKRLYGAVTIAEHKQRIGQYYTLSWNLLNQEKLKTNHLNRTIQLVFRYKRASTGNKIKTTSKSYPFGTKQGKWAFNNIGQNYATGGRILAWRAELIFGGQIISTKESFLWSK